MSAQIKIKAIVYCRVSSKEQEDTGYSLDSQGKLLTEYADKNKFSIEKAYRISESASGKQVREKFNQVLEYATKNKIDIILCEKIDRLTRNLKDAATVDDWVKENLNRAVHFVKENFILSQQTKAHDNFIWDMKVAVARFYTNNLSEEVRKGQNEKLAQGWIPMKAKYGYKTEGEKGHKIHIIDAWSTDKNNNRVLVGNAIHIKNMFEWYATKDYSVARVEKELYEAGFRTRNGKKLGISRIHIMLQDPFYMGKIKWKGALYPGKHEALISPDIFYKVQKNLKRKLKGKDLAKHNTLFKGKIVCEHCGGIMTWYQQKGHWYGHCNNHGAYARCEAKTCMRQEAVEEQLVGIFDVVAPKNNEVLAAIVKILKDQHEEKAIERKSEEQRLNKLISNVQNQKDRIYEAKLNNEVPAAFVERKLVELTTEEEKLENALVLAGDKSDIYKAVGIAAHELAYFAKNIYEIADTDDQRLLLNQLFTNLIQNRREIKKNYTEAAQFLLEWMPKLNKGYELSKSLENGSIKGKAPTFADTHPIWLPR